MKPQIIKCLLGISMLLGLWFKNSIYGQQSPNFSNSKDHALFFAVSDYQNWGDLKNPISDAQAIAKVLEEDYGFKTEMLLNPTKEEIQNKILEYIGKEFARDEQLLIYFSGHGEFIPFSSDSDEGKGYFIPSDAETDDPHHNSYLFYGDFFLDINAFNCEHIFVIVDACHSGAIFDYKGEGWQRPGEYSDRTKYIQKILSNPTRLAITSAGKREKSKDGANQSPMTQLILETLVFDAGSDNLLNSFELYGKLVNIEPVPEFGWFGKNSTKSNFLFFKGGRREPNNPDVKVREDEPVDLLVQPMEIELWVKCLEEGTSDAFKKYLEKHPVGFFSNKANSLIKALEEEENLWATAVNRKQVKLLKDYQKKFFSNVDKYWMAEKLIRKEEGLPVRPRAKWKNMVLVEEGSFKIGCQNNAMSCDNNNSNGKEIFISSFFIDPYEVTNQQYAEFLTAYGSEKVKAGEFSGKIMIRPNNPGIEKASEIWKVKEGFENYPVVEVTWYGANEYAEFYELRLPTEAEWEYAARGGIQSKRDYDYAGGNNLFSIGWYKGNFGTHPKEVGLKPANEVNLHDMSGNVKEWCYDWYDELFYTRISDNNPQNSNKTKKKVIRGGGWRSKDTECYCVERNFLNPNYSSEDVGFRCIRPLRLK